eukprot:scaffold20323_cov94-Isochrysis_galbana.AAC.2
MPLRRQPCRSTLRTLRARPHPPGHARKPGPALTLTAPLPRPPTHAHSSMHVITSPLLPMPPAPTHKSMHHIFDHVAGAWVGDRLEILKRLVEIGEGGLVVLLLRVQGAGHHVDLRLQHRRAVDCVCGRAGGRQRRLGLGEVVDGVVDVRLDQVDLNQLGLVVQPLYLLLQIGQQRQRLGVRLGVEQQRRQARLDALAQKGALLGAAPLDRLVAQAHLQRHRVGDLSHLVDERPHHLCRPRLWDSRKEGPQRRDELRHLVALVPPRVELAELVNCRLFALERLVAVFRTLDHGQQLRGLGVRHRCVSARRASVFDRCLDKKRAELALSIWGRLMRKGSRRII